MLDPQVKKFLNESILSKSLEIENMPIELARRLYKESRLKLQPKKLKLCNVRNFTIDIENRSIAVREYKIPSKENDSALPCLIYFHGGGWVIGDLDTHDTLCRELCLKTGYILFAINYRKAPENKFPSALNDAVESTNFIICNSDKLGLCKKRISIGGDSAGANLATVTCQLLKNKKKHKISLQLLIYPVTDLRCNTDSYSEFSKGYSLTKSAMKFFRDSYIPKKEFIFDPRVSPVLSKDLRDMPKTLIITAGFDPLRDEGLNYADTLSAFGNNVQIVCFERQIHGFILMGGIIDESNTAVNICADFLRNQ